SLRLRAAFWLLGLALFKRRRRLAVFAQGAGYGWKFYCRAYSVLTAGDAVDGRSVLDRADLRRNIGLAGGAKSHFHKPRTQDSLGFVYPAGAGHACTGFDLPLLFWFANFARVVALPAFGGLCVAVNLRLGLFGRELARL